MTKRWGRERVRALQERLPSLTGFQLKSVPAGDLECYEVVSTAIQKAPLVCGWAQKGGSLGKALAKHWHDLHLMTQPGGESSSAAVPKNVSMLASRLLCMSRSRHQNTPAVWPPEIHPQEVLQHQ